MVAGTFAMSRKEIRALCIWASGPIALWGFITGLAWGSIQDGATDDAIALAVSGLISLGVALFVVVPRIFARYELRDGFITSVTRDGLTRWRENLATVPRVMLCTDNISNFITLRWPERRRTFVVPNALAEAINAAQDRIDDAAARTKAGIEPSRP